VKYRVDPDHIGVYGHSAGGHLVACLGTMREPSREGIGGYGWVGSAVQAVVDASGPVDFRDDHFYAGSSYISADQQLKDRQMMQMLLGPAYDDLSARADASPICHASAGVPPTLVIYGEKDTIVSPAQASHFAQHLRSSGVPVEEIEVKNGIHGLGPAPGGQPTAPDKAEWERRVLAFYDRTLR
jgi:acetyl esterase/lipase